MPITSTAGRFDNAPAHIILISPRFNPREIGARNEPKPKFTKEESDAKYLEKLNRQIAKEDIRKAREAIERLQKMDLMRRHELAAKRKRMVDVRPGETKNQRRARREKEKLAAKYAPAIAALPPDYMEVYKMDIPVCLDTAYVYLRRGYVKGVKIGQIWYASHVDMLAGVEAAQQRHRDTVRKNIERKVARK